MILPTRILTLYCLVSVYICSLHFCAAEDAVKKCDALLRVDSEGQYTATYDLGQLSIGGNVNYVLRLKNNTGKDLTFTRIVLACSCTKAELSDNTLPDGGAVAIKLGLKHSQSTSSVQQNTTLFLETAPNEGVTIRLKYGFAALLDFVDKSLTIVIGHGDKGKKIMSQVLVTEPIRFDDLVVSASDGLQGLRCRLATTEAKVFLECTLDAKMVNATGAITIRDSKSGKETILPVLVSSMEPITILPSVLRFTNAAEEKNYRATALARIDEGYLRSPGGADEFAESHVEFSVKSSSHAVGLKAMRIAKGLYRLSFETVKKDGIATVPDTGVDHKSGRA